MFVRLVGPEKDAPITGETGPIQDHDGVRECVVEALRDCGNRCSTDGRLPAVHGQRPVLGEVRRNRLGIVRGPGIGIRLGKLLELIVCHPPTVVRCDQTSRWPATWRRQLRCLSSSMASPNDKKR